MKRVAAYLLPIALWAGTIFVLSAQSRLPTIEVNHFDKLVHASVYAVLGLLFTRALRGYGGARTTSLVLGILFASAYGATDEVHQMITPGRSPDVRDWIADSVGAVAGAFAWTWFSSRLAHRKAGSGAAIVPAPSRETAPR